MCLACCVVCAWCCTMSVCGVRVLMCLFMCACRIRPPSPPPPFLYSYFLSYVAFQMHGAHAVGGRREKGEEEEEGVSI